MAGKSGYKPIEAYFDGYSSNGYMEGYTPAPPYSPPLPLFWGAGVGGVGTYAPTPFSITSQTPFSLYLTGVINHSAYQCVGNMGLKVRDSGATERLNSTWGIGCFESNQLATTGFPGTAYGRGNNETSPFASLVIMWCLRFDGTNWKLQVAKDEAGAPAWYDLGGSQYEKSVANPFGGAAWPWGTGADWKFVACDPNCGTGCGSFPGCATGAPTRLAVWENYLLTDRDITMIRDGWTP